MSMVNIITAVISFTASVFATIYSNGRSILSKNDVELYKVLYGSNGSIRSNSTTTLTNDAIKYKLRLQIWKNEHPIQRFFINITSFILISEATVCLTTAIILSYIAINSIPKDNTSNQNYQVTIDEDSASSEEESYFRQLKIVLTGDDSDVIHIPDAVIYHVFNTRVYIDKQVFYYSACALCFLVAAILILMPHVYIAPPYRMRTKKPSSLHRKKGRHIKL